MAIIFNDHDQPESSERGGERSLAARGTNALKAQKQSVGAHDHGGARRRLG